MKLVDLSDHRRMNFGGFVDKIFWAVVTGAAIYCSSQMREMTQSIQTLNVNMSLALYQLTESEKKQEKTDFRLDRLESEFRSTR